MTTPGLSALSTGPGGGRATQLPRALAGPNAGSGTALPRPAANDPSRKRNKASGPEVARPGPPWPVRRRDPNKARALASRPRPGLPIGPRTLHCRRGNPSQVQPVSLRHFSLRAGGYEGRKKETLAALSAQSVPSKLRRTPTLPLQQPTPCRNQELNGGVATRAGPARASAVAICACVRL